MDLRKAEFLKSMLHNKVRYSKQVNKCTHYHVADFELIIASVGETVGTNLREKGLYRVGSAYALISYLLTPNDNSLNNSI